LAKAIKGDERMPDQNSNVDLLDQLGGEPLEGSGFETEVPETDSEWRDPQ
jgi:hypothetical protein